MRTSLSVLALAAVAAAQEDVLQACDPARGGALARAGFDLTLWNYPWTSYNHQTNRGVPDRTTFESQAYLQGGYARYEELGQARAVTNLTFVNEFELGRGREMVRGSLPPNYNFPDEFNISNFAYLATGYFRADQDGAYNFTLDFVDDYAAVALGGGRAFECCREDSSVGNPASFQIDARWARNGPVGRAWTVVNLQRGAYYPLRVFYVNTNNWAGIRFTFTDPSGVQHDDFSDHVFQFDDQPNACPEVIATTTLPYDGAETVTAYTTLATYTNNANQLTTGKVVVINTPYARAETTTTNGWTGSFTTTLSTGVATVTGSDGVATTETTYYVVTPEAGAVTTTTNGWTGTHTTTLSTGITTVTGADGIATTETTYYVVTPEVAAVTTTINGWTGSFTTTLSTGVTTVTGTDGIATTETTYYVVTPEAQAITTTTSGWTGSFTTTLSTGIATVTGSDGVVTTETTYYVVTPEAAAVTTTTSGWTGNYTATLSTAVATVTGSDGIATTETIYYVVTPEAEAVTTTTSGWTGSFTTTLSTGVATVTGTDGIATTETTYYVVTPEAEAVTTTTSGWTGNYTTTLSTAVATVTGSDGLATTETTYYVVTPEAEAVTTTTSGWTGSFTTTLSTGVATVTGTDGIATTETTYYVVTPEAEAVTTTTSGWTGNYTTTLSTAVATVTGSDGVATTETTYYVVTPEAVSVTTTTSGWTGNYTATLSTAVATVTGSDGIATTETTYYVVTPDIPAAMTTASFSSALTWKNATAGAKISSGRYVNKTIDPIAGMHTQLSGSLSVIASNVATENVCPSVDQETVTIILSPMTTMTIPTTGAPQITTVVKTVYATLTTSGKDYSVGMAENSYTTTTISVPSQSTQMSSTDNTTTQDLTPVDEIPSLESDTVLHNSAIDVSSQSLEHTLLSSSTSDLYTSLSREGLSLGNTDGGMVTILPISEPTGVAETSPAKIPAEPSKLESLTVASTTASVAEADISATTGTSEHSVTATVPAGSSDSDEAFASYSKTTDDTEQHSIGQSVTEHSIDMTSTSYISAGIQESTISTTERATSTVTGTPVPSDDDDDETKLDEESDAEIPEESYGEDADTDDTTSMIYHTISEPAPKSTFNGSGSLGSPAKISSHFSTMTKPLLPFFPGGAVQLNGNLNTICSALIFVVTTLLL
ncbi:AaceriAFL092Cp [[Ashbya] aceris (nom. inval.)]|nr:AaceriAFL092Cp [[Ashbya] aceris (nom. inval.)]